MKQKIIHFGKIVLGGLSLWLLPLFAHAQGLKGALNAVSPIGEASGMKPEVADITGTIIKGALSLIGLIFFLLMVYAGYLWMTARGETEPVDKARDIFSQSVIGLIIVVSAYAITVFVTSKLGK